MRYYDKGSKSRSGRMMMKTPVFDFAKEYAEKKSARFHMPGHKGNSFLGIEKYDITEIIGADNLYSANGIIAESEKNASKLFGSSRTFYSTEGSTLVIKAMLTIAANKYPYGKKPPIFAARNAHKSFLNAAALLDLDVRWIYTEKEEHICVNRITAEDVRRALGGSQKPFAVYLTSPDYLGNVADVAAISAVCHEYGIPLIVDNAHGAYLNFLSPSNHPISLGADMCCDSAHKTLPVLTGGAYLHISKSAPSEYVELAPSAFSLFASTSPSYLILESLDLANLYIENGYREKLSETILKVNVLKDKIAERGFTVMPSEPLKIVVRLSDFGYAADSSAEIFSKLNIEPEYFDRDYIVFMVTPENKEEDFSRLESAFLSMERKPKVESLKLSPKPLKRKMSIREAALSPRETVSVSDALSRICASPAVCCPPAVPIVVSGELIDESAVELLKSFGVKKIDVVF